MRFALSLLVALSFIYGCTVSEAPSQKKAAKNSCLKHGESAQRGGVPTSEDIEALPACCPGTVSVSFGVKYDESSGSCMYLAGAYGTLCLSCGDGTCDSEHEDPCTCPADCGEPKKPN